MIFVIPRGGKTYIGTTDTFYEGDKVNPVSTVEDKNYLLKCVNVYFSGSPLTLADIESGWAGLRPLIKKPGAIPSEISRKDEMFETSTGLITIAGGKLTGYRKMAKTVLDLVAKKIDGLEQKKVPACKTEEILLPGGNLGTKGFAEFVQIKTTEGVTLGIELQEVTRLIHRYGSHVDQLFQIHKSLKKENEDDLPLSMKSELLYAIENEMCLTPCDYFIRRTGMLYFDIDSVVKYKDAVVKFMGDILSWNEEETARFAKELDEAVKGAR